MMIDANQPGLVMRLTLRTLLSYLDDTLEPAEARLMGEKVAESEVAAELIERIAKVTRRRGLSAPAVTGEGGDTTDPNTVAEYLDNALSADQIAHIEQSALDSDEYLAEIAACHQILTLVLGEPAKVPPTARQRMYRVVKGKESIPYRKPSAAAGIAGLDHPESSGGTTEFELPLLTSNSNQLALPLLGVLILSLALISIGYLAIPSPKPPATQGYIALATPAPVDVDVKNKVATPIKIDKKADAPIKKTPDEEPKPKDSPEPMKDPVVVKDEAELLPLPREFISRPLVAPPEKPNLERRAIARLDTKEFLLLQRKRETREWTRAIPSKDVFSSDTLMSLPGNRNDIKLENGVRLQLWGLMPEFNQIDQLDILESRMVLHVPPTDIDADFTLESGRIFITLASNKDAPFKPVRVRVRFKEEVWEITLLDPQTEVCMDLLGYYDEGAPFSLESGGPAPTTEVYFALLAGRAGLRMKFKEFAMLNAPTRIDWESVGQDRAEPKKILPKDMDWWSKTIKDNEYSRQLQAAIQYYANRFSKPDDARIEVAFYSAMQDRKESPGRRMYAVRCLQALDAASYFADGLNDDLAPIRRAAIRCTQHWTGLAPERDLILYKVLHNEKSYTEAQAKDVMQLLHPFSKEDYAKPGIAAALFDAMKNEKIAIRELACRHLEYSDPAGAKEAGYFDAGAPENVRDAVLQKWKASWNRRFADGK